ncbi:hypothetical protein L9F63_003627 [Diploptera punctata]|uniref:Small RNA 2'-O-methyltransferase n=2 Tax=Diploptera punctata TaxID=6984 RepID=A0AAD8E9W2_DIPPU|nr:hypothetical protein L9F63_003627 [Diploptera punctata]
MIVLFHTFFTITKYILTIITKSVFCKTRKPNDDRRQDQTQNVIFTDTSYLMESEADIEEGIGVRFFPPVYVQRYTAVKHVLQDERWLGKINKVVDFGCAEFGFFIFMKNLSGIQEVLSVDVDRQILEHNCCRAAPLNVDYLESYQRSEPLVVRILNGSIADTDPRLLGTDAVICIELIEHLYPDVLEEVPYTVFGYIEPLIAVFTTPNSDFNVLFPNLSGFRHPDHKFEWTRSQFEEWALNITSRYPAYNVNVFGVGKGPPGTESYGSCSQMAVFTKIDYQSHIDKKLHHDLPETEESDVVYEEIRCYEFPYHIDNRTDDEKILHEAEYYIRVLAMYDKYNTDKGIYIPLKQILPRVEKWNTSETMLKNLLEDAGWEVEISHNSETCVVYPCFDPESSIAESDDYVVEEQSFYVAESMEDDWDTPAVDTDEQRDTMLCNEDWKCSGSAENCKLQENRGMEVCSSTRDNIEVSDSESVNLKLGSDTSISFRTKEVIDDTVSMTSTTNVQQSNNSSPNLKISQPLTNLESEQASGVLLTQFSANNFTDKLDRYSEADKRITSACSNFCGSLDIVKNEGRSYNEALTKRKIDELENFHRIPLNVSSENSRKNKNFIEDFYSDQPIVHSQTNPNPSDCNKVNYSFDTEGRQLSQKESEEMHLNFIPESSGSVMVHQKSSHSLCIGCATPSTLESSQERSLIESYSLDEQNDKAVDSGYPNSYSVQDMDMDLTPEQVDEIYSESEEVVSDNSNSYSVESDSESDDENNHDHNRLINNDGFLLNFRNELLYEPMVQAVENGDVANNNRDGEGNNAVAVVPMPADPEVEDQIDHDFIPILAAAEDFDNDNDLIIPEDVEPFPHWLLHLLGLVQPVNGGGDLNNYLLPPDNLLPDEGLGDADNNVVHGSNSSVSVGDAIYDVDDLEDLDLEELQDEDEEEEEGEEVVVPGDIGGGGEPDSFQEQE